jgi:hypothetical protein
LISASGDGDKPKGETPISPPRGRRRAIERIVGLCGWMDCSCCSCCSCSVEEREGNRVARAEVSVVGVLESQKKNTSFDRHSASFFSFREKRKPRRRRSRRGRRRVEGARRRRRARLERARPLGGSDEATRSTRSAPKSSRRRPERRGFLGKEVSYRLRTRGAGRGHGAGAGFARDARERGQAHGDAGGAGGEGHVGVGMWEGCCSRAGARVNWRHANRVVAFLRL